MRLLHIVKPVAEPVLPEELGRRGSEQRAERWGKQENQGKEMVRRIDKASEATEKAGSMEQGEPQAMFATSKAKPCSTLQYRFTLTTKGLAPADAFRKETPLETYVKIKTF